MEQLQIKVYDCKIDGLPEIGRPFVAFETNREKHAVYIRLDKQKVEKDNDPKDNSGHISPDGEYYSGPDRWIFAVYYEKYCYVDEMNLIPQSHYDKVEKEVSETKQKLQKIKKQLISTYGQEDASILQNCIYIKNDNRKIEVYPEDLIHNFKYSFEVDMMYESLTKKFDKTFAKKVVNTKLLKETGASQFNCYKIKLDKNLVINEWWQDVLLHDHNCKGFVANGHLYVINVIPWRSCELDGVYRWLESKKIIVNFNIDHYWERVKKEDCPIKDNLLEI